MSLLGTIRTAGNTLSANQIALQVVGQNIANANTPGYIREEVVLTPAPTQRIGHLLMGMGVEVKAVVQKIDTFLEERLHGAVSDRADTETLSDVYTQLEGMIGELSDTDLSTALNDFFSAISEVLNQPESASVRNLVVLQGEALATEINRLTDRASELRDSLNNRVVGMVSDINRLTEEVRVLNVRIAEAEGGNISESDAVGLRDQRLAALEELAGLINIRVVEQASGGVVVYTGSNYLVFEGSSRQVTAVTDSENGLPLSTIRLVETDSEVEATSGELHGLMTARDDVLGDFVNELDSFARTLAFEFNRIYSCGQGLRGFERLESSVAVGDGTAALNAAGLEFAPRTGSFQVLVFNNRTGLTQTNDVMVDLTGLHDDMTLDDLRNTLDAIDGISAETTPTGHLILASSDPNQEFAFANDTSGILAALGLNVFFTGTTAANLGVNSLVKDDPTRFAASSGGIGLDTENATQLAAFLDRPLDSRDGASLAVLYDRMVAGVSESSSVAQAEAAGAKVFELSLRGQEMATSGVNLDEEAIQMITCQRSYQAAAKLISVLSDLLDLLVSL